MEMMNRLEQLREPVSERRNLVTLVSQRLPGENREQHRARMRAERRTAKAAA